MKITKNSPPPVSPEIPLLGGTDGGVSQEGGEILKGNMSKE